MEISELEQKFNTKFKRQGKYWVALCPFHQETSPSFFYFPQTETCYCFGCHKFINLRKENRKPYRDKILAEKIKRLIEKRKKEIDIALYAGRNSFVYQEEIKFLYECLDCLVDEHFPVVALRVLIDNYKKGRGLSLTEVAENTGFCRDILESFKEAAMEVRAEKFFNECKPHLKPPCSFPDCEKCKKFGFFPPCQPLSKYYSRWLKAYRRD